MKILGYDGRMTDGIRFGLFHEMILAANVIVETFFVYRHSMMEFGSVGASTGKSIARDDRSTHFDSFEKSLEVCFKFDTVVVLVLTNVGHFNDPDPLSHLAA